MFIWRGRGTMFLNCCTRTWPFFALPPISYFSATRTDGNFFSFPGFWWPLRRYDKDWTQHSRPRLRSLTSCTWFYQYWHSDSQQKLSRRTASFSCHCIRASFTVAVWRKSYRVSDKTFVTFFCSSLTATLRPFVEHPVSEWLITIAQVVHLCYLTSMENKIILRAEKSREGRAMEFL